LAFSVAESEKLEQKLKEERIEVRALALYIDAQNHPSDPIQDNPWIQVRAGIGGYSGIGW
jgi:hypothetical protein